MAVPRRMTDRRHRVARLLPRELAVWALAVIVIAGLTTARGAEKSPSGQPTTIPARDPSVLIRLVRSGAVQEELKLAPNQRRAVDLLVADVEYPLFQVRDWPDEKRRERVEPLADRVEQLLKETLTEPQRRRLFEIVLRAHGWPAVLAPQQAGALKLSGTQIAKIREVLEEAAKEQKLSPEAEKRILDVLGPEQKQELARMSGEAFDFSRVEQVACKAPELRDVTDWINTQPLNLGSLRGQVVAVHFFAFGCGNCINNQPHYQAWHERFADQGLMVLGIHTPETERERDVANLKNDVQSRSIKYPIAVDGKSSNWAAWANHMWPSVYLVDKRGYVRYWWYGELNWQGAGGEKIMRDRIEQLIAEPQ